jgi:hypothetical protein
MVADSDTGRPRSRRHSGGISFTAGAASIFGDWDVGERVARVSCGHRELRVFSTEETFTREGPIAMAESVVPENVGNFLSDHLAAIQRRAEEWRSYYAGTVTLQNIVYWLWQFGGLERVRLAYRLLEHVHFLDESKISSLLSLAIAKIPAEHTKTPLFCPIGKPYDSAGHISYGFAKQLGYTEQQLNGLWTTVHGLAEAIRSRTVPAVIFIDDNITSGTQLRQFLSELLTNDAEKREHLTSPLDAECVRLLRAMPVYFAVAVDLAERGNFEADLENPLGLRSLCVVCGHRDYTHAFQFGNQLWASEAEANAARDMVAEISPGLFSDKSWPTETLANRVLGYGNLAKLTVFAHNVPKSLLPIFWKYGEYRGRPWFPLFPEREEWRRYPEHIRQGDPYVHYFAGEIAAGTFRSASPLCTASLVGEADDGDTANVLLPKEELIQKAVKYGAQGLEPLEHQNPRPTPRSPYGIAMPVPLYATEPSAAEFRRYNRKVDQYNHDIGEYKKLFQVAAYGWGKLFALIVRVRNKGTAPATEVIVRLELIPGLNFFGEIPDLPDRPTAPHPPASLLDAAGRNIAAFRNPQTDLLRDISQTLRSGDSGPRVRLESDRGNRYVTAFVGKVVQHTYRDVIVRYLVRVENIDVLRVPYQLIYEQAARPVEGTFEVRFGSGDTFHPDVLALLRAISGEE